MRSPRSRSHDVTVIGIAVHAIDDPELAYTDLRTVARGTGAVVRGAPIDCDGEGVADVGRGDPMVGWTSRRDMPCLAPFVLDLLGA